MKDASQERNSMMDLKSVVYSYLMPYGLEIKHIQPMLSFNKVANVTHMC
jgi:hypothetical protein